MSTAMMMAFVVNLISLLSSAALVRPDQSAAPLRSFTISGNVTYDCVDIYKQPSLDNPLLKNHKIQMKPFVSSPELKNQTGNSNTSDKKKIRCLDGTVPILRNTKEFIINSQFIVEKFFRPQTVEDPGTHIAGIRTTNGPFHGVQSAFKAYIIPVGKDQAAYGQIYLGSGLNNQVNFISAGFMINPSQFGDGRVWSYGFWKGKDGKGCYNIACSGFVQVSKDVPIGEPEDIKPGSDWSQISIHQDKNTGNWWITQLPPKAPSIDIGYWPKELFNLLNNGANMVGAAGVVKASHSGSSPLMGNGRFPTKDPSESAIFTNIEVLDSKYKEHKIGSFSIEQLLDSPKCYGLKIGKRSPLRRSQLGYFFNYGGPGGISCGI